MSDPRFIIALDQGTTSSRTIVFDRAGRKMATAQRELTQHYPKSGWVEHDANEIWSTQYETLVDVMASLNLATTDIAAIGITNQRETLVVWDSESGEPTGPALVWQDRRTADDCRRLVEAGFEAEVSERTGLRLDPYFTGTKLAWMLRETEGLRDRAERGEVLAGTIDTWLLWKLTKGGVHATDASNASRTLLLNIETGEWDERMIEMLDIPRAMLPEVKDSVGVFGCVAEGLVAAGVPIAGMAGDQQAALFGQGCFINGMVKNTYGTGCFLLMQTGEKRIISAHNLLTTVAWRIGGKLHYALEGAVFVAGAAVQWARDELKLVDSASELSELAASVPDAGGVICVPAFTGLGAPHWDPYARGTITGLTRGTNRAHICRAILESIALQSADLIDAMRQDSGLELAQLRVDGGAAASDPLMQIQSNLLQTEVVRPANLESTALGAAHLAGLGIGFWTSQTELREQSEVDQIFSPDSSVDLATLKHDWKRAVKRAYGWASAKE